MIKYFVILMITVFLSFSCNKKPNFKPVNSLVEAKKISNLSTAEIQSLEKHKNHYIWIQNVRPISFNQFTSSKGNQVLKVKIQDLKNNEIEGIFFETDFNNTTVDKLAKGMSCDLLIKVTEYKGKTSFIAKYITESEGSNEKRDIASEGKQNDSDR